MLSEERLRGLREHARHVGQNNPIISAEDLIALLDEITELRTRMGAELAIADRECAMAEAERDALAARLATITAAGIVVGEDGAVRWHGLTGAEIMAMTMEVGRLRTQMLRAEHILEDALAAAAGRGADGEAT